MAKVVTSIRFMRWHRIFVLTALTSSSYSLNAVCIAKVSLVCSLSTLQHSNTFRVQIVAFAVTVFRQSEVTIKYQQKETRPKTYINTEKQLLTAIFSPLPSRELDCTVFNLNRCICSGIEFIAKKLHKSFKKKPKCPSPCLCNLCYFEIVE